MKPQFFLVFSLTLFLFGCSGVDYIDDYVSPTVRITNPVSLLTVGNSFQFEASYFNNIGELTKDVNLQWESSNIEIIEIDSEGNVFPKKQGIARIIVKLISEEGVEISDQIEFEVENNIVFVTEEMMEEEEEEIIPPMDTTSSTMMIATVTPTLQIANQIVQITVDTEHLFEIEYIDENGMLADPSNINWESSDPNILSIDENGRLIAEAAGSASITVSVLISNTLISNSNFITVVEPVTVSTITSFSGSVQTTSSYVLEGGFTLSRKDGQLVLSLDSDYKASSSLPGLYVYLSNNRNTSSQAYEIGKVTVFQGAHEYLLPSNIGLMDYQYILYWCKPFNVKVGEAVIYN